MGKDSKSTSSSRTGASRLEHTYKRFFCTRPSDCDYKSKVSTRVGFEKPKSTYTLRYNLRTGTGSENSNREQQPADAGQENLFSDLHIPHGYA